MRAKFPMRGNVLRTWVTLRHARCAKLYGLTGSCLVFTVSHFAAWVSDPCCAVVVRVATRCGILRCWLAGAVVFKASCFDVTSHFSRSREPWLGVDKHLPPASERLYMGMWLPISKLEWRARSAVGSIRLFWGVVSWRF